MVWVLVLLFFTFSVNAQEDTAYRVSKMLESHLQESFGSYEIVSILPLSKSYIKSLEDKEFDSIQCKSKGSSNLYLYLNCSFLSKGSEVASLPVTVRIRGGVKVAVEKNKKVNILYIDRNIRISMVGVALQSGKVGDYIEVKNISTGKVLKAKVISDSEVLVEP